MLFVVALMGMSVSTSYAYRTVYDTYRNGVLIISVCVGSGGNCLPEVIVT